MFPTKRVFSGFSVDDLSRAKEFYENTMGLRVTAGPMGLSLFLPEGAEVFVYAKENHQAATFTILNFEVDDIDAAVDHLVKQGVVFEHYASGPGPTTDSRGIMRGIASQRGPDIAWFKDPAGNFLSVLQPPK